MVEGMQKEDIPFKNYNHDVKMENGFHFTIDRDGHWYCHDPAMGVGPIKNERISKLFAGAGSGKFAGKGLSRDENGRYWLKAPPADVYGIDVEDVPFVITSYELQDVNLALKTNFGEEVILDDRKSFISKGGVPYIEVRGGLMARIGRNVFYQLAEKSVERDGKLGIMLGDRFHELGQVS